MTKRAKKIIGSAAAILILFISVVLYFNLQALRGGEGLRQRRHWWVRTLSDLKAIHASIEAINKLEPQLSGTWARTSAFAVQGMDKIQVHQLWISGSTLIKIRFDNRMRVIDFDVTEQASSF